MEKLAVDIGELLFELSFPGGVVEALMTSTPVAPRKKAYEPVTKRLPAKRRNDDKG